MTPSSCPGAYPPPSSTSRATVSRTPTVEDAPSRTPSPTPAVHADAYETPSDPPPPYTPHAQPEPPRPTAGTMPRSAPAPETSAGPTGAAHGQAPRGAARPPQFEETRSQFEEEMTRMWQSGLSSLDNLFHAATNNHMEHVFEGMGNLFEHMDRSNWDQFGRRSHFTAGSSRASSRPTNPVPNNLHISQQGWDSLFQSEQQTLRRDQVAIVAVKMTAREWLDLFESERQELRRDADTIKKLNLSGHQWKRMFMSEKQTLRTDHEEILRHGLTAQEWLNLSLIDRLQYRRRPTRFRHFSAMNL